MTKKEKRDSPKKNTAPDPIHESDPRTLKDNPEGETICHADFSDGCINEDTDASTMSQKEVKIEKY